jgi:Zn-dependent M28 family amino/carboxypeptidase
LLRRVGAVGLVVIPNPKIMDMPWDRSSLARLMPSMRLADPALDEARGLKFHVTVNPAHADKLFAGSGHTFQEVLDAAAAGKPLPHFALPLRLRATAAVKDAPVLSENVVAVLPGNDPTLQDEYVVFTAHLDHLGIAAPIKGDSIYNGAMDNASGVATMLDVAAMLNESATKLRRSVLFVAVTAEEKGLLGSQFFAQAPTVDPRKIEADINIDMILPHYPLKILTMFGSEESDLGDDAAAVARSLGVQPRPDPVPERNVFIRGDQYSFIRRGIPSLMVMVGFDKDSPEEQIVMRWLTERYHSPSDDVHQPLDRKAAGEFDILVAKLLERVANRETRPRWKPTSFFKRFADSANLAEPPLHQR